MSPTQIEEQNNEEETTEPLVFDSGASAHFYPTAFDEESPNDGRSQEHKIIIATGVALNEELLSVGKPVSVGTLVRRQDHPADLLTRPVSDDRRIRTYARTTAHVRPEQPSLNRVRLSAAGNRIQHVDISSNYLHIPFDPPIAELPTVVRQRIGWETYTRNYCFTHGNDGTNHHGYQCRDEDARRSPR